MDSTGVLESGKARPTPLQYPLQWCFTPSIDNSDCPFLDEPPGRPYAGSGVRTSVLEPKPKAAFSKHRQALYTTFPLTPRLKTTRFGDTLRSARGGTLRQMQHACAGASGYEVTVRALLWPSHLVISDNIGDRHATAMLGMDHSIAAVTNQQINPRQLPAYLSLVPSFRALPRSALRCRCCSMITPYQIVF